MNLAIIRLLRIYVSGAVVFIVMMTSGGRLYASDVDSPWIGYLAGHGIVKQPFAYPVNEINLHIDLDKNISERKMYLLRINVPDLYHLFCLKEILKKQKIRYLIKNQSNNIKLLIYLSKKQNIELLLKSLRDCQLKIKVLSNKEEK